MHIHLDAVGGVSGNMFIGAVLDTYPAWAAALPEQLALAGFADLVTLQNNAHSDGVLHGSFFQVSNKSQSHSHESGSEGAHDHHHRPYSLIRETLSSCQLDPNVQQHALGIFRELAEAEAEVHGKAIDDVHFHEVGAWDSIADVVCAAFLIEQLNRQSDVCTWSVSSLPLGRGLVDTAHGKLPVPAPAVSLLLKNFAFYQDDIDGERVTPTGASILKYLMPSSASSQQDGLVLVNTGLGFGSKIFPGISNVLRLLVFDSKPTIPQPWQADEVLQIQFEVDDQSAEDLSIALDTLRAMPGVLDVCHCVVFGKKGRFVFSVQVLAETACEQQVIAACFNQCPTIGLRKQRMERAVLKRHEQIQRIGDEQYRVKAVARPDGTQTHKVAADDLASKALTYSQRMWVRQQLENSNNDSEANDE